MSDPIERHAASSADPIGALLDDPSHMVPLFQPVVELGGRRIIGFEALARWPDHPTVNTADVFDAARVRGALADLDSWCRRRAVEAAYRSGMHPSRYLFVNVEPQSLTVPDPGDSEISPLSDLVGDVPIVLEFTERTLATDPPRMLAAAAWARRHSFGIALDDVGSRPESLALLDVIAPDVVKLDRSITQMTEVSIKTAKVISTTAEYARRHGATVLAEGVEHERDAVSAEHMGATLGQGYLYGRPSALPASPPLVGPRPVLISSRRGRIRPLHDILAEVPSTIGPLTEMTAVCKNVEGTAITDHTPGCVVARLPGSPDLGGALGQRYRALAARHHLVGLVATGLGRRPLPGVYGPASPGVASDVFAVAAIGADYAISVIGASIGDSPADANRYRWSITTERAAVADIARSIAVDLACD